MFKNQALPLLTDWGMSWRDLDVDIYTWSIA